MQTSAKIKVGIQGAAGYTGGELIRLLIDHPHVELRAAQSKSHKNERLAKAHPDLFARTQMNFCEHLAVDELDLVFICSGHGKSVELLKEFSGNPQLAIIDLSQDFRCDTDWTYGLVELNQEKIKHSKRIANPGCFATCIQLALLPAVEAQAIDSAVNITAITGSTGAGQSPQETTHFSWRSANLSVYKAFNHQHENEILFHLTKSERPLKLHWIPMRGPFSRGILASINFTSQKSEEEIKKIYQARYEPSYFTHLVLEHPDLKQVINTNNCYLSIKKHQDQVHIVSVIDNLIKGASGQAVENMNLMFGFDQNCGLKLKACSF